MDSNVVEKPAYTSPLRARQTALTRDLILRATAQASAADPLLGFSMQEVADRARVSLRSVYRHFPGRKQLFEALYDWTTERLEVPELVGSIKALDDMPSMAGRLFARFESEASLVRASVIASLALGMEPVTRVERDQAASALFRRELSHLPADEAGRASAVLRLLFTSRAWLTLSERYHLNTASAAEAVEWAARTLIDDLKRRNDEQIEQPATTTEATTRGDRTPRRR
jgi:AcrR family transcriptional regulator